MQPFLYNKHRLHSKDQPVIVAREITTVYSVLVLKRDVYVVITTMQKILTLSATY